MRFASVVGARPQFIKAAVLSRAIADGSIGGIEEVVVHTGQHFDPEMSANFFSELEMTPPSFDLGVGGGGDAEQLVTMMPRLEEALARVQPDIVVVFGDTNSTLAGALAASRLRLPLAHVEAGLRSDNLQMREELNRVVTDRLSTILFAPTQHAVDNLVREGLADRALAVGDVMYDNFLFFARRASKPMGVSSPFVLATIHRAENVDDDERLRAILGALEATAKCVPVVLPIHPRLGQRRMPLDSLAPSVETRTPLGYVETLRLLRSASAVVTDSGGLQKEAYWAGVPCLTMRDETEWTETVASGWNRLVSPEDLVDQVDDALRFDRSTPQPPVFGDGHSGVKIIEALLGHI